MRNGQTHQGEPALACKGATPDQCARSGTSYEPYADCRASRTGHSWEKGNCQAGWRSTTCTRQRQDAWAAQCLGRQGSGQDCPLYGGYICLTIQSGDPAFLSTPTRGGQARQGRSRCLHAKATHHLECNATKRPALEPATDG